MHRHRAGGIAFTIFALFSSVVVRAGSRYDSAATGSQALSDVALIQSMAAMSSSDSSSDQKKKDLAQAIAMMQMAQAQKAKQAENKNREADKKTESTEAVKLPTLEYPKPYDSPLKNVTLTVKDIDVTTKTPADKNGSAGSGSAASPPTALAGSAGSASRQSDRPVDSTEEVAQLTRGPVSRQSASVSKPTTVENSAGIRPPVVAGRVAATSPLQPVAGQLPTPAPDLTTGRGISPDLGKQVLSNLQSSKTLDDDPRVSSRAVADAKAPSPHESSSRSGAGYGDAAGGGKSGGGEGRLQALLAAASLAEGGFLAVDDPIRVPKPRLRKKKGGVRHPDDPDPDWNIFEYAGFRMERLRNKHKRIRIGKRAPASEPVSAAKP